MSNIRVVDVNDKEGNVNEVIPEVTNEEVKQEEQVEQVEEAKPEIKNDIIEDVKEEVKEEVKEKPKRQTQKDKIQCPKCLKQVSIKTYKYGQTVFSTLRSCFFNPIMFFPTLLWPKQPCFGYINPF